MALLSLLAMLSLCVTANGLMPYSRTFWDTMLPSDDPFRILEQTPLSIPRAMDMPLALARADWKETPSSHVIVLDLPGLKKDDVKIEIEENHVLRISGERKPHEDVETDKWHRAERTNGRFWRQFRLPRNTDVDNVTARLQDGLLTITVPKLVDDKKRQPKVIDIAQLESNAEDVQATKAQMFDIAIVNESNSY
ncbi:22.0 kDa heat shock protein, partial [Mucuna pruriens]